MTDHRIDLQAAYVLHARAYRDTSLIIDVLTQDYGRVCLVAKGARKAAGKGKSYQRSILQPFITLQISWQGKSSLKTLVGAEAFENYTTCLSGHRLYSALYVNELLLYLLPQENPTDDIYYLYQTLLTHLSDNSLELEPCLRQFEFQLLEELGYGINFYTEADTDVQLQADTQYSYVLNHGFVQSVDSNYEAIYFQGKDLLNLQNGFFDDPSTCQTAKAITRLAFKPHLKGKTIKSRELFF